MTEDIIRIISELSIEDIYDSNGILVIKDYNILFNIKRLTQNNLTVQRTVN